MWRDQYLNELNQEIKVDHVIMTPLFGELPLSLTLLVLLLLQLRPQLLTLADKALRRPVVRLQQLGLVQRPQLLQLRLVFGDELLNLWLQTWSK